MKAYETNNNIFFIECQSSAVQLFRSSIYFFKHQSSTIKRLIDSKKRLSSKSSFKCKKKLMKIYLVSNGFSFLNFISFSPILLIFFVFLKAKESFSKLTNLNILSCLNIFFFIKNSCLFEPTLRK